jgi:hypothetical protein
MVVKSIYARKLKSTTRYRRLAVNLCSSTLLGFSSVIVTGFSHYPWTLYAVE